ncbi:hypothetical protein LTR70_009424 [Exophiala xenobiotica]|uniref:Heterokaryon incompatibility domain-containing protein n=1 Tax=Lithohypha guttulata TaxID=1690604 RepID=A0ABR0JXJ6_9EURO|nr:hypothetical protein LTR24_009259 [Lithohypha guttulata]KAK5310521.1 hypothetical protein LTR70_009424 [Exophiala xenobiotica]
MANREIDPEQSVDTLPMYLELVKAHIIRLVELRPAESGDKIDIRLHIHELEHAPSYEAISYVWGVSPGLVPITCNGKPFSITATLDAAFRRIRLSDRSRIVWADAVCINQRNTKEKNHHVAFMNLVYRHAEKVLVCMGAAPDDDARNIRTLINKHQARTWNYKSVKQMPILASDDPLLEDPRWISLTTLFENKWFTRAWVMQEVGVAVDPVVLYGNNEFRYRELMKLARWIIRCASQLQRKFGIPLLTVHTDWVDWSKDWKANVDYEYGLVDFLSAAKGLKCSVMHDHIYAFIGHHLLQKEDGSGPIVKPDYDKPVKEVFREFTTLVFPMAGPKFLSAVEHDPVTVDDDLPSWIVRWDMDVVWNSMGYYHPFYYRASGPEHAIPSPKVEGDRLIVDAAFVDVVNHTYAFPADGNHWPEKTFDALMREDLRSTINAIRSHVNRDVTPCYYLPSDRLLALALSLGAGLRNYERAEDDVRQYKANFDAFCEVLDQISSGKDPTDLKQIVENSSEVNKFYFDLNLSCKGRSFFVTRKGYFGLGPLILQPGDECHIFKGARVPFILRRTDGEFYKLLGEAYVHGIMNGELVPEHGTDLSWSSIILV